MKSIRTLTIALASLIAMPALAQDATTDTTSDAASKRFAVVGGAGPIGSGRGTCAGADVPVAGMAAAEVRRSSVAAAAAGWAL